VPVEGTAGRGAIDRLFTLGLGGAVVVVVEAITRTDLFQEIWVPPWIAKNWLPAVSETLRIGATGSVWASRLRCCLSRRSHRASRCLAFCTFVGVALMVGGALWLGQPYLFVGVWQRSTGSRRPALTTRVASAEPVPHRLRGPARPSRGQPPPVGVARGARDALGPAAAAHGNRIGACPTACTTESASSVISPSRCASRRGCPRFVALGFATGFLHYWLDRAVFRFSRPAVRVAARGLL
jgi:hypothetical protein